MRVGIVGSRKPKSTYRLETFVRMLDANVTVVSGGAPGVDSLAVAYAKEEGLSYKVYKPKWGDLSHPEARIKAGADGRKYDANAGFRRNQIIVDNSDVVIAFWDGKSPGTTDTIKRAKKAGKLLAVVGC